MYPCPSCQSDRNHIEEPCSQCGWNPAPLRGANRTAKPQHEKIITLPTDWTRAAGASLIFIAIFMCIGAAGFILNSFLMFSDPISARILVGPAFQVATAVVFVITGWLFLLKSKRAKPMAIVAVLFFCANIGVAIVTFIGMATNPSDASNLNSKSTLFVEDPESSTVVTVSGSTSLFGGTHWNATISADGKRSTQHTGWPVEEIGNDSPPVSLTWHSNPDWVEIELKDGQRLKLEWDQDAIEKARFSDKDNYYLSPKFTLLDPRE